MSRPTVAAIAGLCLAALAAGCGPDGPVQVEGEPLVDGAPELVITGSDFQFSPAELTLRAGEAVNIRFEVTDGGHNFVIADTSGEEPVAVFDLPIVDEGEFTTGGLVIDEPGTYQLVCTVPGHLAAGMRGTVVVE